MKKIVDEIKEKKKREITPEERKATNTAFLLMFPSVIIACIAAFYAPVVVSVLAVLVTFYQFLMLKKFIEDYYKR